MNTRQRIESIVKNTTDDRGRKQTTGSEVRDFYNRNPEGKNQMTYKSLRDAIHIYCEFHPEKVEQCVEAIVSATIAGDSKMARILGDFYGGPDKQQLELSGSLETRQNNPLNELTVAELRKLKALKEQE